MGLIKPIGTLDKSLTKPALVQLAADHAKQIIGSGNYDLLKTYVEMKRYELYIKTIIAQLKNHSVAQAQELRAITQQTPPVGLPGEQPTAPDLLPVPTASATSLTPDEPTDDPVVNRNSIQYNAGSVQLVRRTTYDFTQDAEWQRLTAEMAQLKTQLKQREEYLKTQENTPVFVQENMSVRL